MEGRQVTDALVAQGTLELESDETAARRSGRAYAALALGAVLFVFAIWYQVYGDTRRDAQAWTDPLLQSHRQWRLRTAFVFLVWSILAGFCVPFGLGALLFAPIWLWFVYRVIRGSVQFARRRVI